MGAKVVISPTDVMVLNEVMQKKQRRGRQNARIDHSRYMDINQERTQRACSGKDLSETKEETRSNNPSKLVIHSTYIARLARKKRKTYCDPIQEIVSVVTRETVNDLLHLDMLLSKLAFDMVEALIVHEITTGRC